MDLRLDGLLLKECAFQAGHYINGAQIDEDGKMYFVLTHRRLIGGRPFLSGCAARLGEAKAAGDSLANSPYTGTLVKAAQGSRLLVGKGGNALPLDEPLERPPDVTYDHHGGHCWIEGADWLYAGASPIVSPEMICSCPTQRIHLDWYKRLFVPESYRHAVGVLDTNGNLIVHLGRYGNRDDAMGMKTGDEDIPNTLIRFVSGTDSYLTFEDWGERLAVLKLGYHAEKILPVPTK